MANEEKKKEGHNVGRVLIEPMPEPEKPVMDREGRISPWTKRYHEERTGRRKISRRT